jgi:hypothetical protein
MYKFPTQLMALTLFATVGSQAFAQTRLQNDVQRDANQQQRIEQGLQSGQLSTGEADRLEHQESRIDRVEAHDAQTGGKITPAEQARLNAMQNHVSQDIAADRHNGITGNPARPTNQRLANDIQRDVNQQQRIAAGVANGSLTNREAGRLEQGQAHDTSLQARAAHDGRLGQNQQQHLRQAQNRQSQHIYNARHNGIRKHG